MRKLFASILFTTALFAQSSKPYLTIQNPSFEQGADGWQFGAGSTVIQFNGIPVADAGYGSSFQQTLQVPEMPSGIYTLSFSVANYFYWYPGQYTASISLSKFYEAPLCSVSGHPLGDFTRISLVCPVRNMYAQDLTISFYDKGWQSLFTNVSLTFTPTS